jgi:putative nucleotidyltransferase with HDIG domain
MVGGMVSALPAGLLRNRWDLLKYGVLGGLAQGAVVLGLSTLGSALTYYPAPSDALAALGNCLGCAVILLGAMPLLENAYAIITNIRLLELADHGHPALRKIQFEAPGTWAHTISVEFLAVPAAEAIGANARLVRAGVFSHDLGKTLKPEYFVENNPNAPERHRRLAPSVSALIITGHVKDGIQLAREFRLPRQIVDFIPEHHGTTLVSYFYHSARKRAEEEHGEDAAENVQEAFFQYPGPKPQSRETAIVMLADTVEAASRTLENPSLPRIRTFVHELIMQKLLNGQLDESDLTFRDLARIEEEFNRVLMSRYHSRIKYPGQEGSQTGGAPRGRADKSGLSLHDSDSRIQPLQRSPERGAINGEETPDPTPAPTNGRAREQSQTPVPGGALPKAVPATREGGV